MFIKPGDLIRVRSRDRASAGIKIPMFQVKQIVGDIPTIKLIDDCVIVATDHNLYPLRDFDIIYVNGTDLSTSYD